MTDDVRRCARGNLCEDSEQIITMPVGDKEWVGARVDDLAHQFCATCTRYLGYALNAFPLDVAELTTLLPPSLEVRYRDSEVPVQPRVKKGSPLGFNGDPYALIELIDDELTAWAASTAVEVDVAWDRAALAAMRPGARVKLAATFLKEWTGHFLGLPAQRHRARSLDVDPAAGHHDDQLEHDEFGLWVWRNGTEGALALFRLHHLVENLAGRAVAVPCRMACPKCERPALVREHRTGKVLCRCCWREMTDADYETYCNVLNDLFGLPV